MSTKARREHGGNRDPIYAPDGKTWYDHLLREAEKRGRYQDALLEIERLDPKVDTLPLDQAFRTLRAAIKTAKEALGH